MTIEEATDLLSEMIINCNLPSSTDPKRFLKSDALTMAIDSLQTNELYRWHDLIKDQEDLPNKDGLYLVAVRYNDDPIETGFGQYENVYGYGSGWTAVIPGFGKVIAWREIEPFEEQKNE